MNSGIMGMTLGTNYQANFNGFKGSLSGWLHILGPKLTNPLRSRTRGNM